LPAVPGDAHARGHAGRQLANEEILGPVRVRRDEIRRGALEEDDGPVGRDAGNPLHPFASAPKRVRLARSVVPVARRRTKTSSSPFVSPGTRFEAGLWKATTLPVARDRGKEHQAFPCAPPESRLTRDVAPAARSRTKTSARPFASPGARSEAPLANATKRPSWESDGRSLGPFRDLRRTRRR
jgi:hypothetical protein